MSITVSDVRKHYKSQILVLIETGFSVNRTISEVEFDHGNCNISSVMSYAFRDPDEYNDWTSECPIDEFSCAAAFNLISSLLNLIKESSLSLPKLEGAIKNHKPLKLLRNLPEAKITQSSVYYDFDIESIKKIIKKSYEVTAYLNANGVQLGNKKISNDIEGLRIANSILGTVSDSEIELEFLIGYLFVLKDSNQDQTYTEFMSSLPDFFDDLSVSEFKKLIILSGEISLNSHTEESPSSIVFSTILSYIEKSNFSEQWQKPWTNKRLARPINFITKKKYTGINCLSLLIKSSESGYSTSFWATEKQWNSIGYHIKQDAESATVFSYFKKREKNTVNTEQVDNTEVENHLRWASRAHYIYNADQLTVKLNDAVYELDEDENQIVESFVMRTRSRITHGNNDAYYDSTNDIIYMPNESNFFDIGEQKAIQAYNSTLLHELIHWTGNKSRCNRKYGKEFGDLDYAFEELIAELGSAFLCADLKVTNISRCSIDDQIDPSPISQHAAYIKSWLSDLDFKKLSIAAHAAEKAVSFLEQLQSD